MKKFYILIFLVGFFTCSKKNQVVSQQSGTVSGYVYQSVIYIPMSQVIVSIENKLYTTSSDGYYEINYIPIGNWIITANAAGCISYSQDITVKSGNNQHFIYLTPG